jgi:uncharacterized membrane protein HdeD (DUF308 family)
VSSSVSAAAADPGHDLDVALPRWWVPVLVGALAVVAGVIALVWPGPTLLLIGICFGAYLVVAGAGNLVSAFTDAGLSTFLRVLEALLGILTLLAGAILIVRPGASVVTAAFVLGFWFLIAGCVQLARGMAVAEHRAFNLGFGLLGIAAGAVVLAQPGIGVVTLVWVVGIAFLLRGAIAIALGLALRSLERADAGAGARRVEPAT